MPRSSEKQLWCAVLDQLLIDATNPYASTASIQRDRDHARVYLTKRSRDLDEVCALAGVEVDRVMATAKTKIEAARKLDSDPVTQGQTARRRPNALLHHDGRSLTVTQWAAVTGISKSIIYARLQRGMTTEQVLTAPVRRTRHRGAGEDFDPRTKNRMTSVTQESTQMDFSR